MSVSEQQLLEEQLRKAYEEIGKRFYEENKGRVEYGSSYSELFETVEVVNEKRILLEKRTLAYRGMRRCENCQQIITIDSVFCNKCGAKLEELPEEVLKKEESVGKKRCGVCGYELEQGDAFCPNCGNKQ